MGFTKKSSDIIKRSSTEEEMTLKKDTSLSDAAYSELKRRILSLELMPGDIVSDFSLSQEIGMSRTPIREAIFRLRGDGLLIEKSRRGYEVRRVTPVDVTDLFDAREGIERTAVEIAIRKGVSDDVIQRLSDLNKRLLAASRAEDFDTVFDLDSELHNEVIIASGNARLREYYASILLQLRRMRLLTYFRKDLPEAAYHDHRRIIEAIGEGDVDEATAVLHSHISGTRDDYLEIMKENIRSESDYAVLRFLMSRNLRIASL